MADQGGVRKMGGVAAGEGAGRGGERGAPEFRDEGAGAGLVTGRGSWRAGGRGARGDARAAGKGDLTTPGLVSTLRVRIGKRGVLT